MNKFIKCFEKYSIEVQMFCQIFSRKYFNLNMDAEKHKLKNLKGFKNNLTYYELICLLLRVYIFLSKTFAFFKRNCRENNNGFVDEKRV